MTGYSDAGADLSEDGRYRWHLWREWDFERAVVPFVLWVMLNPSTADGSVDDPTIRRCVGFTRRIGYKRLEVVNLFSWRATKPKNLIQAFRRGENIIGSKTPKIIDERAQRASLIILAWGGNGNILDRGNRQASYISFAWPAKTYCLGKTATGQPKHPLFVQADQPLEKVRRSMQYE